MEKITKYPQIEEKVKYVRLKVDYHEEGTIHKFWDDGFAELYPYFMCQICWNYVLEPVSCGNCDTIFCSLCLTNYSKFKGNICPNRCQLIIKPLNRILKNLIHQIKIDCLFYFKGCRENIKYYEYEKHLNECEFGPYKCLAPYCYYVDIKSKIITHTKFCVNFNCNKSFHSKILQSVIILENKKLKTNCIYCEKTFNENIIQVHSYICEFQLITCKICDTKMTLSMHRKYHFKSSSQCLSNQYERKIFHIKEKLNYKENLISLFQNKFSMYHKSIYKRGVINLIKDELEIINCFNIEICNNYFSLSSYEQKQKVPNEGQNRYVLKNPSISNLSTKLLKTNFRNNFIFIHDNNLAIYGKGDGVIYYYDTSYINLKATVSLSIQENEIINYLLFMVRNEHNYIVVGTKKGLIIIFQVETQENKIFYSLILKQNYFTSPVEYINYYKNNNKIYLVISAIYSDTKIIQFPTGQFIANMDHRNKIILSFIYLPDFNYLITTTKETSIRIWQEVITKECSIPDIYLKFNLKSHQDFVWSLVRLDKDTIASGSGDKTIKIWEVDNLENIQTLMGHNDSITILEKSQFYNQTFLFSGSYDGEIKIWVRDLNKKWENIYSIYSHKDKIFSIIVIFNFLNSTNSQQIAILTIYSNSENSSIAIDNLSMSITL